MAERQFGLPNCLKNCLSMSNDDVSTIDGTVIFDPKIFNTEMFSLNGEFDTSNFTSITLISELHGL